MGNGVVGKTNPVKGGHRKSKCVTERVFLTVGGLVKGGDGEVGPNDCCEATGDGRMWSGLGPREQPSSRSPVSSCGSSHVVEWTVLTVEEKVRNNSLALEEKLAILLSKTFMSQRMSVTVCRQEAREDGVRGSQGYEFSNVREVGFGQDIGGVEVKDRDTHRRAAEQEEVWMTTPKKLLSVAAVTMLVLVGCGADVSKHSPGTP